MYNYDKMMTGKITHYTKKRVTLTTLIYISLRCTNSFLSKNILVPMYLAQIWDTIYIFSLVQFWTIQRLFLLWSTVDIHKCPSHIQYSHFWRACCRLRITWSRALSVSGVLWPFQCCQLLCKVKSSLIRFCGSLSLSSALLCGCCCASLQTCCGAD